MCSISSLICTNRPWGTGHRTVCGAAQDSPYSRVFSTLTSPYFLLPGGRRACRVLHFHCQLDSTGVGYWRRESTSRCWVADFPWRPSTTICQAISYLALALSGQLRLSCSLNLASHQQVVNLFIHFLRFDSFLKFWERMLRLRESQSPSVAHDTPLQPSMSTLY